MKRLWTYVRRNAVMRFWMSYMLILIVFSLACLAGVQESLHIVRDNMIEKNQMLLRESVSQADGRFETFRIAGMRLAASDSLRQLGRFGDERSMRYLKAAQAVLLEYADTVRYYDTYQFADVFIYINGLDRVIYDNAVYQKSVFQIYPEKWGIAMEEWMELCTGEPEGPGFYPTESGQLLYAFPCTGSVLGQNRQATVVFRINMQEMLGKMGFLKEYSGYSLFISQKDNLLFGVDGLQCGRLFDNEKAVLSEVYYTEENIVLSVPSGMGEDCVYTLCLPSQEAVTRLLGLQTRIYLELLLAAGLGTIFAVFFSVRSGRPINRIAKKLQNRKENEFSTNLDGISRSIDEMIEEQKQDQAAVQKTFFYNLLKADFISRAEMEHLAQRAGLQLKGTTYYAASVRFFPEIDADSIDAQTVEEVRVMQMLIRERLRQEYGYACWSYKRNTLITQYIIEAEDDERLYEDLAGIVLWLKSTWHMVAYWGIGRPCGDLMNFWKSTEEANAALSSYGKETAIRLYSEISAGDGGYYLPYSTEEHLVAAMRSGDYGSVENALDLIFNENFVRRSLSRRELLKLNRALCDSVGEMAGILPDCEERFVSLSGILVHNGGNVEAYFSQLKELCGEICRRVAEQKTRKKNDKIQEIVQFMEKNYSNPGMGLGMVSEQFKLSVGYLSTLFKDETSMNFADCLEKIRIREACSLLKEGELIANVAQQTGYNSVQSFRRAFKRAMDVSPSEYRERILR